MQASPIPSFPETRTSSFFTNSSVTHPLIPKNPPETSHPFCEQTRPINPKKFADSATHPLKSSSEQEEMWRSSPSTHPSSSLPRKR
ncbi:hypothetical protein HAX54_052452 [Datura stramonium]|uniref:Uncharacterized protein n=1 Tax=Datura stramonium TaxID=4076 RepID=A0ABS8SZJ9_DATST|nr:hypothetical protein [Datura stramonium]